MKFVLPKYLQDLSKEERETYKNEIQEIEKINQNEIPLQFRVMKTKIDIHEKVRIIKLIETYEQMVIRKVITQKLHSI